MKSLHRYFLLGVATSCLMGCISAHVDFEDIQVTRQNITFPGVPADVDSPDASQIPPELQAQVASAVASSEITLPTQQFAYANASSQVPSGVDGSLTLERVTVTSSDPQRSISFVRTVTLTSSALGDPTNKRVILSYTADPASPSTGELSVPIVGSSLTIDPWQLASSVFELTVTGSFEQLPREPWAVDVTLSLAGEVEYSY